MWEEHNKRLSGILMWKFLSVERVLETYTVAFSLEEKDEQRKISCVF